MSRPALPEEGEYVIGRIKEVKDYGAIIAMPEYDGETGFVHISEVAAGWVKYIRDHIREGQAVVCKVIRVRRDRGMVDLSTRQVSGHRKKQKIQDWKNEQKAEKFVELVAEELGIPAADAMRRFGHPLREEFGSLYRAFELALEEGDDFQAEHKGDWVAPFIAIAETNITPPFVSIEGFLNITSPAPDGVKQVSEALETARAELEDTTLTITSDGAPRYRITVRAPDYKQAEHEMKQATDMVLAAITERGGEGSFTRP